MINTRDVLIRKTEQVSDDVLRQVLAYLRLLKENDAQERLEPSLLSEATLAKDWLRPEEDEAWKDL